MLGMPPVFQRIGQIIQNVQQIKSNPSYMGQFLLQQGAITPQQYQEMQQQGIDGNPEAIGQYMMNHGIIDPRQASQVKDQMAMPIQNSMRQN